MRNNFLQILIFIGFMVSSIVWAAEVPIMEIFRHKIVYAMGRVEDEKALREDCQRRGGTFKECGNVCDDSSGAVSCVMACAYTCEGLDNYIPERKEKDQPQIIDPIPEEFNPPVKNHDQNP